MVWSVYGKCRDVAGRIAGFLPKRQFVQRSSGQRGLICLPGCATPSCLLQAFKSGFTAAQDEAIALSSSAKAHFWLAQKRKIIWYKLLLGNTSPSSTAIFFCDVEDNLMSKGVRHLISLPLLSHLTHDALGHVSVVVITRYHTT